MTWLNTLYTFFPITQNKRVVQIDQSVHKSSVNLLSLWNNNWSRFPWPNQIKSNQLGWRWGEVTEEGISVYSFFFWKTANVESHLNSPTFNLQLRLFFLWCDCLTKIILFCVRLREEGGGGGCFIRLSLWVDHVRVTPIHPPNNVSSGWVCVFSLWREAGWVRVIMRKWTYFQVNSSSRNCRSLHAHILP